MLIAVAGSQTAFAAPARKDGTLVLSGGINATFELNRSNCIAGPRGSLTANGLRGGSWDSLDFYAVDPPPGHKGTAEIDLDGSGYVSARYAIDDWIWKAKKNSGHIAQPMSIAANGRSGTVNVVLPVADIFLSPKTTPVKVSAVWTPGTCKD